MDAAALAGEAWRLTPDRLGAHLTRGDAGDVEHGGLAGPYQRPGHVRYLGAKIAQAIASGNGRLIVNLPPQAGKSMLVSRWTPLWFLHVTDGRARVLLGSYEARFAASWGRSVREQIERHGGQVGLSMSPASTAADEWQTTAGGGMQTAGVGGALTGKAGDLIVVDDPIKNFKEAHSPTLRDDLWNWFNTVVMSRVQPHSTVIVVHTRWHEDDLTGRLLSRPGHDRWNLVRLPALADRADDPLGRQLHEPLWPERFDRDFYDDLRVERGPYVFAGMYQQLPAPLEGEMFRRDRWQRVDAAPAGLTLVRRWDLAATEDAGDWTVGVLMGRHPDGRVFVVDVARARLGPSGVETLIRGTAEDDRARYGTVLIRLEQEPGSSGKAVAENYVARVLAGFPAKAARSTGDKTLRALPYAAQQEAGNVHLVRRPGSMTPEWWEEFVEEHAVFPNGVHDDMVDAASLAFADLLAERKHLAVVASPVGRRMRHRPGLPSPPRIVGL